MGSTRFAAALRACKEVTIDTQTVSHYLAGHEGYAALTSALFRLIEQGQLRAVVSTITFTELLTLPIQQGNVEQRERIETFFAEFPNMFIVPFDSDVAPVAAQVRASTRLSLPDAMIVATAQHARSDAIISNDLRWRNRFTTPRLLLLDDYR